MKARVTLGEIAEATKRAHSIVARQAKKAGWPFEIEPGSARRRLYPVDALPIAIREAILHHQIKKSSVAPAATLPAFAKTEVGFFIPPKPGDLMDWQRKAAEARCAIIHEVKRLAKAAGLEKAIAAVIALAKNNELPEQLQRLVPVANAKAGTNSSRTLSRTSIFRWMKEHKRGFAALAPRNNERMDIKPWAAPLLQLYGQPQKPSLNKCLEQLPVLLPPGVSAPSYFSAQRFLNKMSKLDLARGRMLPRELKNVRAFVRRDTSQMLPGDAYTADGHTFDAEITHPKHGRPFRPEITSVIDIATRKSVGWSVDLAESTWAVLDAVRHSVETCGIPSLFYVDNGSGYKNALMNDEATGFMTRLGITLTHSLPYNSQARGIIERSHQTIWVAGAKEFPTYMGAKMDREAKQAAFKITRRDINTVGSSRLLMPFREFVEWCKVKVDAYNNRPHRGLPKIVCPVSGRRRHQTPNEAWTTAIKQGWEPFLVPPDEAADLFRPYRIGKTERAEVRLHGNIYFHRKLEHYHGERVRIGYDIRDADRVWVRDLENRLICIAEFEANKTAYFPVSQQQAADEIRAKGRIKRAQAKIDEAEQELNPPKTIEWGSSVFFEPAPFKPIEGVPAIQAEPLPANAEYLPVQRPMFTTDAAKYRWLRTNPSQKIDQDEAWLDWYCNTDEFDDLFAGGDLGEATAR